MSFLVIALAGIATQVLYIICAIQISLTGPDGQPLWQTDSDLNNEAAALFYVALLLTFGFVIYAAVKAIRLRRWGWLIEVIIGTLAGFFFLSGVALIIFGLFAPSQPRESRARIPVGSRL